jgi:hypothetical protein
MIEVEIPSGLIESLAKRLNTCADELVLSQGFNMGGEILRFVGSGHPAAPRDTSSLVRSGALFTAGQRRIISEWMYPQTKSKYGPWRDAHRSPQVPIQLEEGEGFLVVIAWGTPYAHVQDARTNFFSKIKTPAGKAFVSARFRDFVYETVKKNGLG